MDTFFKRFRFRDWLALLQAKKVSQLTLKGFKPTARDQFNNFFKPITLFIGFLLKYILKKVSKLGMGTANLLKLTRKLVIWSKESLIKKLIWSRGRLGRPIANAIVLGAALIVFVFGEILNSNKLVNSQEIDSDYLSNVSDIIANTNTALTTIPDNRKQTESFSYTVEPGDTLSGIGQKFKISIDALEYVNGLTDNSVLSVGKTITIPPSSGLIHKVESGDTLASIAKKYEVPQQAIADFNYLLDAKLAVGTELVIPGAKVPQPVYVAPTPAYISQPNLANIPDLEDGFIWPTTVRVITQYFSWYHNGLDIAVPWGWGMPPLWASSSGTVTRAGWDPWGLGLHVVIDHGGGYQSVYGHMSRLDVKYGQRVSKGDQIGLMGNTGRSTGPHIHFIIKYNGVARDPLKYID